MYSPPQQLAENLSSLWRLRPDVAFLNHGSFGAVPRAVAAAQEEWRQRIEAEPIEILARRCPELLEAVRRRLGGFLHTAPTNLGLVTNATEAVNSVVRDYPLRPGDELLTTDHVYNAVRQTMRHTARRAGAEVREVAIPLPVSSAADIAARVLTAITPRTRLLVIDHVTSPTALVFPVAEIIRESRRHGVDVLVDGAHAPGMIDLDLDALAPAFYTGNLHKWVCAPRGSAFLYVHPDRQQQTHAPVISHDLDQGFIREFAWQGTRDLSAWLAILSAIEFFASFGHAAVRRHNFELCRWAHELLCTRLTVEPVSPLDGSLLGSIATVRLPARRDGGHWPDFQQRLYDEHHIEVPLVWWNEQAFVRTSSHIYNRPGEYERLAGVLESLIAT
ncbi:MAG: aminotransferase class V-fold PLP-dependent enzyme [Tepidisphaeraceae bacterium]|jgi:isopenicillin-N epimerase